MLEVKTVETRTPIEIALDIDSEGMTTARKLYEFLELRKGDFARWCKTNITENEFATENEDYARLFIDAETPTGGKIQRQPRRLQLSTRSHSLRRYLRILLSGMQWLMRKERRMKWQSKHTKGLTKT